MPAGVDGSAAARQAVERAARESRGRLVAYLASRSRNVAAAEDALADAFEAALREWAESGVPGKPDAWLLAVARNRMIDAGRRAGVRERTVEDLLALADEAFQEAAGSAAFPDERLKLLFVCAHPAIDAAIHTPLMLQTVMGLDAGRIASAFLVAPATMGQRLSRAKRKIRDAGIGFEVPEPGELAVRLDAVLNAIYAAFGSAWEDVAGADPKRKGLADEALELGRMVAQLLPGEPEPLGLLALMLHCHARRRTRRGAAGQYVPLPEQHPAEWDWPCIQEAEELLQQAQRGKRLGRFQLEAAIQSAHARRAGGGGGTDWEQIVALYGGLICIAPTLGAHVARAAALAQARGAAAGWSALQALPAASVRTYQPYWALAAHLLKEMKRTDEAASAYGQAIALCEEPAVRDFLARCAAR